LVNFEGYPTGAPSLVKSPRIWLILREKTYDEYKKQVPSYWQLKQEFHDGDLIIGLYENKK